MADEKQFDITIEPVKTSDSAKPAPAAPVSLPGQTAKPQEDTFLTNIFEKKSDEKSGQANDSKLMEGLIKMEEKNVAKQKSILDKAPEINTSLFIDIEYHLKRKLTILKGVFGSLIVLFLIVGGVSYATLSPDYDYFSPPNIGTNFNLKREDLTAKQNELNKIHYQIVKRDLDLFLYKGLLFRQKYNEYDSNPTQELEADLKDAESKVAAAFDVLAKEYTDYKNYQDALLESDMNDDAARNKFNLSLIGQLTSNPEFIKGMDPKEVKEILTIVSPSKNAELIKIFKDKKSSDITTHEDYNAKIKEVSALYSNPLTIFNSIKDSRIHWAKFIGEINRITKLVDASYEATTFSSTFVTGTGIKYVSFNIDNDNTLKISGIAVTPGVDTFTMLAYLIDGLNKMQDPKTPGAFTDAEMRTFYKNSNTTGGSSEQQDSKYTSNFTITAKLNPKWKPTNK
ncbi:MAG: hypothetical protein US89_C0011G0008 [Candidatus Peregrinibacteria bacterium GW2011_GWF2_38_29]|nr:MAG: hypothetical protein US89_C0011G0008 [Candidatus Peregrinibacteria bacterium GW2011_GWF2_38_29]HBB02329.1 hypothetical protein [Candidatus Peregrinibacteria bacterium]